MKRKLIALLTAAMLLLSLSVGAMAASFEANDFASLSAAFGYTGEDTEVIITLTGDTLWYDYLTAEEGKVYTINGQNYILKEVYLGGSGEVIINADIEDYVDGDTYSAVETEESVKLTVNGDINASEGGGVMTWDESSVTVNGHITAVASGVEANEESTVTVNGNITAEEEGVLARYDAAVTVSGNITSETAGAAVENKAKVTVEGDIYGKESGIYITNDAEISVTGDVSSGKDSTVVADENAVVTIDGNVTAVGIVTEYGFNCDPALDLGDNASVTVTGDVRSEGDDAITVYDEWTWNEETEEYDVTNNNVSLEVGGSVYGGNGSLDEVDLSVPSDFSDGSNGIVAEGNAVISVAGDVHGGDGYGTYGYGGTGLSLYGNATVIVGGSVYGGDVTADPDVEASYDSYADSYRNSYGGAGITMDSTSHVIVGGDVIAGTTNGDRGVGGTGVSISMVLEPTDEEAAEVAGELIVSGAVQSAADAENADDSAAGIAMYFNTDQEGTPAVTDIQIHSIKAANGIIFLARDGGDPDEELTEEYEPAVKYTVNLESNEGGGVVYDTFAPAGETVLIETEPDEGYYLASVTLNGAKLPITDNKASFVMPEGGGANVTVTFAEIEASSSSAATTPDTGDHSSIGLYGAVMLVSLLGVAALVTTRKRGKHEA